MVLIPPCGVLEIKYILDPRPNQPDKGS